MFIHTVHQNKNYLAKYKFIRNPIITFGLKTHTLLDYWALVEMNIKCLFETIRQILMIQIIEINQIKGRMFPF